MIDFEITSPHNSLIQFVELNTELELNDCNPNSDECFPISTSEDISFQLLIENTELAPPDHQYTVMCILSCSDEEEYIDLGETTVLGTIDWSLDAPNSRAIGYSDLSVIDFSTVFQNRDCFRLGIYSTLHDYVYTDVDPAVAIEITVSLVINGVTESIGTFTCNNIDDLIGSLNVVTGPFGDTFVLSSGGPGVGTIHIESTSGNIYGTLTIDDGRLIPYEPTDDPQYTLKYCSPCFQYLSDLCFTSVIKYRSDEDSYGFVYEDDTNFFNKVRMKFYLCNPQVVVEENIFRLSDGSRKMLSAVHSLSREGVVNFMGEKGHVALSVALKHDDVYIQCYPETAFKKYVNEGQYVIKWLNDPGVIIDFAMAEFKVLETPFYEENVNC